MSQSSEQAEKMGCKKCGGIKRHAESCKLNTWFLTDPPVPSMVHDDERGSRAQSSEQGAPERIWVSRDYTLRPEYRKQLLSDDVEYTRSDICASLVEALEGLRANRTYRDSEPCWCPLNHLTELTTVEETGEHHPACTVARTALAQVKTDDK